jgi:SAM-dependent methyltransferase
MSDPRRLHQAAEYAFPYHHLPHQDAQGRLWVGRSMRAGMEYLAYSSAVIDVVRTIRPTTLLDVGCGDGRLVAEVQDLVPDVVGIDLDERAVGHASGFSALASFLVQDVGDLARAFEVVTCVETLEHLPDAHVERFLSEVADRVAPGGHLILTVPTTARPVHEKHHRHYDVPLLRRELDRLGAAWTIDRLEEIVPHRRWLDSSLRLLGNRHWTLDVPAANRRILALHRRRVTITGRGLHLLAVVRRERRGG